MARNKNKEIVENENLFENDLNNDVSNNFIEKINKEDKETEEDKKERSTIQNNIVNRFDFRQYTNNK